MAVGSLQLPTFLYRLYDANGVLLYVGITNNVATRMKRHSCEQSWWPRVASIEVETIATRPEAEAAELAAIHSERPLMNVNGVAREPTREMDWDDPHDVVKTMGLTTVRLPATFASDSQRKHALWAVYCEAGLLIRTEDGRMRRFVPDGRCGRPSSAA